MPTGYTSVVADGDVSLKTFVLRCARAFGPCAFMRDEPLDVPPPTLVKPSKYHADALEEASARLEALESMDGDEKKAATQRHNEEARFNVEQSNKTNQTMLMRYTMLLAQVAAWVPPSADHYALKDFMLKQLSESMEYDCAPGERTYEDWTPDKWYSEELTRARWDVEYHLKEYEASVARANTGTQWLRDLYASLGPVDAD